MKSIVACFLLFFSTMNLFSFHMETHQYIVAQAFRLLEKDFLERGGDTALLRSLREQIFYPNGQVWLSDEYQNTNNPWRSLYAVAVGAAVEDQDDPVYGYNTLNGFTPSVTHFWLPDNGDDERHTMGIVDNCENLWMKARIYLFGGAPIYINEPMTLSGTNVIGIFIQYDALTDLLLTGNCQITGYKTSFLGISSTTTFANPLSYTIEPSLRVPICYLLLGRIAHLLSDTGVPAHIHNDAHPCILGFNCDDYENWICYDQAESLYGPVEYMSTTLNGDDAFITRNDQHIDNYDFIRNLFHRNAQNTDYWPSNDYPGNDFMDSTIFYDSQIQYRYDQWGAVPAWNSSLPFLMRIAENTFEFTIGSVASLFSWFLVETDQIVYNCPAPTQLLAEYLGAGSYKISWDATENAQTWVLFYKNVEENEWTAVDSLSTTVLFLDLDENQTYEFKIAPICPLFGRGEECAVQIVQPNALPDMDVISPEISLYPNPTDAEITIESNGYFFENGFQIELFDLCGKQLTYEQISSNKFSLLNFSSGVYVVKIYTNHRQLGVFKVIKK